MKYAIVLDLDGTLLDDNMRVSAFDKVILKKCKDLGHKIIINTTRNYTRTVKFMDEIEADYINCFNGNYVLGKEVVFKNCFNAKTINKVLEILNNNNCEYIVECKNGTYRNCYQEFDKIDSYYIHFEDIDLTDCFKFLIKCDKQNIFTLTSKLNNLDITISYDEFNEYLRVMPKNSEKYNGLSKIDLSDYKMISFGNSIDDLITLKNSFLGVKMKNSDDSLDDITFTTMQDNNNSGVGNFLSNYFNFDTFSTFKNIKVLDCTLRDGGHLNDSYFGYENIINVVNCLNDANIDFIELGFLEDCKYDRNRARFSSASETNEILKNIQAKKSKYSLLTQVDKYDISKLEDSNLNKIDMIRVSFHNCYINEGIEYCKKVKEKGYIVCCNPINFSSYSNEEIVYLVNKINEIDLDYFTIVDTFGTLLNNDFSNKLNLLSSLLRDTIKIGLHLHNNLSSSFSTAQILMQTKSRFNDVIIDTSLNGMGRAPGNLKTELLTYYINMNCFKYNMQPIYQIIESYIEKLKSDFDWNLDFRYSISAFEKSHRSYAEYLIKHNMCYRDSEKIIKLIPEENTGRYDKQVIENITNKIKGE